MINETEKPEFWEKNFVEKQEMWGFESSGSAVLTNDFFLQKSVKNILIPGIGYARNAQIFRDNGMVVTGIEISQTAIEMARRHYGFYSYFERSPYLWQRQIRQQGSV